MKKILLLMAIVLPFVLTSCGDDKDEPKQSLEEQLIGRWVGSSGNRDITFDFKADHTGLFSWKFIENTLQDVATTGSSEFTWSLKGNILSYTYRDGLYEQDPMVTQDYEISIKDDVLNMKYNGIELVLHKAKG